jgi:hypothetical protein
VYLSRGFVPPIILFYCHVVFVESRATYTYFVDVVVVVVLCCGVSCRVVLPILFYLLLLCDVVLHIMLVYCRVV